MNNARLVEFQSALLDAAASLPAGFASDAQTSARFAVHRHTCRTGLIEALRSAYPVIVAAVGDAYFDALAAEFSLRSPPRSPVLQEYSPEFPEFLDRFPPLADWPWLGDVARIDWARREAYHAEDATTLTAGELQAWPVEALMDASAGLHPSMRTLDSPHPAWSLWHSLQRRSEAPTEDAWRAESVQVWRTDAGVHQRPLGCGEAVLRRTIADGLPLGDAIHIAHMRDSRFDPVSAFASLVSEGLIVALNH
jgi:Putative DNA-binding domain